MYIIYKLYTAVMFTKVCYWNKGNHCDKSKFIQPLSVDLLCSVSHAVPSPSKYYLGGGG